MANKIKLRAKSDGTNIVVQMLVKHPMETGLRKDKNGDKIPAHFLQSLNVKSNGKDILEGDLSAAVSKDPYISVTVKGSKGDKLEVNMVDNNGEKFEGKTTSK